MVNVFFMRCFHEEESLDPQFWVLSNDVWEPN